MVTEAIDFRYLLLENYKKLKLSENELAVILMIDHLIGQGNPFITADILSLKMSLDNKLIDKILASLLKKKMIEYTSNGKSTITTLDPLKKILFSEFQLFITSQEEAKESKKINDSLDNIYSSFQKELGRTLSPVEISKIREWVSYGYSDEMIINALKDAVSNGKKSLRAVDKILLNYQMREDISHDGHSSISNNWNANLEETIKIAQTPWIKDSKND